MEQDEIKASVRNSSHLIIYHVPQVSSISLSVQALQSKLFSLKEEKLQGKQVKIQNCRTVLVNTKNHQSSQNTLSP